MSVLQIKTKIVSCHTADSKPVKQEVNGTVILPSLVFPSIAYFGTAIDKEKNDCNIIPNQLKHFDLERRSLRERDEILIVKFDRNQKFYDIKVSLHMRQKLSGAVSIFCICRTKLKRTGWPKNPLK